MDWTVIKRSLKGIMSDPVSPTGNMSWGRWASTATLISSIIWISYLLYTTGHMPPMDGITGYVIAPYTANKVTTVAQSFSQNNGK